MPGGAGAKPDRAVSAGEASALRKASLRLLPLLGLGYAVAYTDRVNISFAAVQMNHALGFSATAYGLGAGLFFVTYTLLEVPSNLLLARFGARRWLARIMITWGIISMGMLLVKTPWQFYGLRLLLGAAEAGFFPGVIYYLAQWFPPSHSSRAISRFYIALPLSSACMGLIAASLLKLQGTLGLAGWQWLFLLEGIPSILVGMAYLLLLPDNPARAPWLSAEERDALLMLRQDSGENESIHGGRAALAAFKDPRIWLLGLYMVCGMWAIYGYIFVAPMFLRQVTGRSIAFVGNLIAATSLAGVVGMLFNGWHSDRSGERYWHILAPSLLVVGGFLVAGVSHRPVVVVAAVACIFGANNALQIPFLTLAPSFLRGKTAAAGIAAVNSIALVGGFIGPYWMGHAVDLTGNYQRGMLTLALPALAGCAMITIFHRRTRPSA
jgi:ACS family tartrate transporter-like MFS transporter